MTTGEFWNDVYTQKGMNQVSWYAPRLATSLRLIRELCPQKDGAIIDIGAGRSPLPGDLLAAGYRNITVMDIAGKALEQLRARLDGIAGAENIKTHTGDIARIDFGDARFALWHDRAVFHFLTEAQQREGYIARLKKHLQPGSHAVIATFAPDGPEKCSGLSVVRYGAESLADTLGDGLQLLGSHVETHTTPFDTGQQFLYAWFMREG